MITNRLPHSVSFRPTQNFLIPLSTTKSNQKSRPLTYIQVTANALGSWHLPASNAPAARFRCQVGSLVWQHGRVAIINAPRPLLKFPRAPNMLPAGLPLHLL